MRAKDGVAISKKYQGNLLCVATNSAGKAEDPKFTHLKITNHHKKGNPSMTNSKLHPITANKKLTLGISRHASKIK